MFKSGALVTINNGCGYCGKGARTLDMVFCCNCELHCSLGGATLGQILSGMDERMGKKVYSVRIKGIVGSRYSIREDYLFSGNKIKMLKMINKYDKEELC